MFTRSEDFTRWIAIWRGSGQLWKKKGARLLELSGGFRCIYGCQKWIPDKILHRYSNSIFFSTFRGAAALRWWDSHLRPRSRCFFKRFVDVCGAVWALIEKCSHRESKNDWENYHDIYLLYRINFGFMCVPLLVYSLQLLELPDAQGILSNEFMLAPRITHSERSLNSTKASWIVRCTDTPWGAAECPCGPGSSILFAILDSLKCVIRSTQLTPMEV